MATLRLFVLISLVWMTCAPEPPEPQAGLRLEESVPVPLALQNEWAEAVREYSGAAVFKEFVVLLPQYPERIGNRIPALPIQQLHSTVHDPAFATFEFDDDGLSRAIPGFEGFEAIEFRGDEVFVTIESHRPAGMMGYLVLGKITMSSSGDYAIVLNAESRVELPPRAGLHNLTDEGIVLLPGGNLLTIYEANGASVVQNPTAYLFDVRGNQITKIKDIPFPYIEYRITDCVPADDSGKFWCINYMYPGDERKLLPAPDSLAQAGAGDSHAAARRDGNRVVERLVQFQFDGDRVRTTATAPVYLKLDEKGRARNWEGLALLPDHRFVLVTDKFPETLFAVLKEPASER